MLGKVLPVGTARRFGHQPAPRPAAAQVWRVPPSPLAAAPMASSTTRAGTRFALLHQFQCSQIVGSVAGQHVHGDDQLGDGVHDDGCLVPVKPSPAALVPVAHLWVVNRQQPVPAHPIPEAHPVISMSSNSASAALALDVLEQQLSPQLRPIHYALPRGAVLRQLRPRRPRQFEKPVRVGHYLSQQRPQPATPPALCGPTNRSPPHP